MTSLMSRPQRLGILPTLSFWLSGPVHAIVHPLIVGLIVVLGVASVFVHAGHAAELAVQVAVVLAALGLGERWIRGQVKRRRELVERELLALGDGE